MKHKAWMISGAAVLVLAALVAAAYVLVNRPWWNDRTELDRIFAHSPITLSTSSSRGGTLLCIDSCPSLTVGFSPQVKTFSAVAESILAALKDHGYAVTSDEFRAVSDNGQVVTGPFNCIAPTGWRGSAGNGNSDRYWQCQLNGQSSGYSLSATLNFPGATVPQHLYQPADQFVSDALPPDTPLVAGSLDITMNH
jgi:hypothetical protein